MLYSNTARAHELGKSRDWTVLYFYDGHHEEGQCTVVTAVLLQLDGVTVLTDPQFSNRASPTQWAGPKRVTPVESILFMLIITPYVLLGPLGDGDITILPTDAIWDTLGLGQTSHQ